MVVKIPTKVTVIAACNPLGKYDSDHPLSVNIGIEAPLLSRFDVVMLILDPSNSEWDELVPISL
jgi:DNA helicase MCM9